MAAMLHPNRAHLPGGNPHMSSQAAINSRDINNPGINSQGINNRATNSRDINKVAMDSSRHMVYLPVSARLVLVQ